MSRLRPLQGTCSCGRNHYAIIFPTAQDAVEEAEVYFDDSQDSRRTQATPITAWLRVPLSWVSSTTIAQFPDETHSSIRRMFTPSHAPHSKRIFCGYCGTHLSYWTEEPRSEADYLNITLGSLLGRDIRELQDLGLLSDDVEPEDVGSSSTDVVRSQENQTTSLVRRGNESGVTRSQRHGQSGDVSWFEELIDGSRLGRTQKSRRGVGVSADGSTTVQWEVSEYADDGSEEVEPQISGSKRKLGEVSDDVAMRS